MLLLLACGFAITVDADPIDKQKADSIAKHYLKSGETPNLVKPKGRLKISALNTNEQAPVYIYKRGEGEGFVIISGDDCLPSVIGYTESGDFKEEEMPPALLSMLNGYANLIEEAQSQNAPSRAKQLINSSWPDISPLVETHWHQSGPYNNMCPTITGTSNLALTGCVATAATQVIYYYHKDNADELLATTDRKSV